MMDQRLIDDRSLKFDRLTTRKLEGDTSLLGEARNHVSRWLESSSPRVRPVLLEWQEILGSISDTPAALLRSLEADVFPEDWPENSGLIDGAIGDRSIFHETFGYDAHGVDESTAVRPQGWRERLVPVCDQNTRGAATRWCLEPHDLAVSMPCGGRAKDTEFGGDIDSDPINRCGSDADAPVGSEAARSLIAARFDRLANP